MSENKYSYKLVSESKPAIILRILTILWFIITISLYYFFHEVMKIPDKYYLFLAIFTIATMDLYFIYFHKLSFTTVAEKSGRPQLIKYYIQYENKDNTLVIIYILAMIFSLYFLFA